jgi:ABC-type Fe3+/spermidine/putrescine transport system ATPase subunit
MPEPAAAVNLVGVTKCYGTKTALAGVDLTIEPGTFCVLLGPSGSGKTTVLRCIAGIEAVTSGRVSINGRLVGDGTAHRPPEQRQLAMVFQDYALWPHLTVLANVAFALGRKHLGRDERTKRAGRMLERVGLSHLAGRYPGELSGGEQQRVALARALVAETGLVLFDEPLSNLDADLRERMRLEIATLTRDIGATSVYITHDQAEAFALADRVGVLSDGLLVQIGPPEDVYHRPASAFVARFTGLAGEIDVAVEGPGPDVETRRVRPTGMAPGADAIVARRPPDGADPSGHGTLLIRPAGVSLVAPDHAERHLDAVVVDAAYRGRGYDHALLLTNGSQLVGIHDEHRWARGSHVGVLLAGSGCLLFPAHSNGKDRAS